MICMHQRNIIQKSFLAFKNDFLYDIIFRKGWKEGITMKKRVLLFDADGTLLDFKKSEEVGLHHVFEEFQIPNPIACRSYYLELNDQLWKDFELGKIERQHIFDVRFQMMLDTFNIDGDGKQMEQRYREWLNQGSHTIQGALALIQELAKEYDLYIVTNGVSKTQYQRLQDSGLAPYFKDIFVSEDIQAQKPNKAYFDYVLAHIPPVKKEEMLLIGDSLSSDILGANQAGIPSCWFNPDHISNDTSAKPDYEISSLEALWKII